MEEYNKWFKAQTALDYILEASGASQGLIGKTVCGEIGMQNQWI